MLLDELDYPLPETLIARYPAAERSSARLLIVDEPRRHARVRDLVAILPEGCLLVVNDTRVRPARLGGHKRDSGGKVEVLLVSRVGPAPRPASGGRPVTGGGPPAQRWRAMGRASKRWRAGVTLVLDGGLHASVAAGPDADGLLTLDLYDPTGPLDDLDARLAEVGQVPLPPYLGREAEPDDGARYQTVFARRPGAVAAPTAGLHFSPELLEALQAKGIERTAVTLHVGPGTFRPVQVEDLDDHPMHAETVEVRADAVAAVAAARARGAPVLAVGTTVVRSLEAASIEGGQIRSFSGETRLLIAPGYRFRVVDALLTNFHLPRSTLLALVYAFGGTRFIREAYAAAVAERYRFFSYGDAMLIPRGVAPSDRPLPTSPILADA